MPQIIYIEEDIIDHPIARGICARYPNATLIPCERYGEIFNRKAQNFRLQKQQPALILARKHKNPIIEAPAGYGVGGDRNFYFSHMMNCVYDCRYCFLQGMHRSAHQVIFVNFEDYFDHIQNTIEQAPNKQTWFFSGYDCDSLAYEPVTRFAERFIPFFGQYPNAWLELRTKSTQTRRLLKMQPIDNCVIAFSFTPDAITQQLEHGVPSVAKRIEAIKKLQQHGWRVGLRFDPMIYHQQFRENYQTLFTDIFSAINVDDLHSVSLGSFRLPKKFFQTMQGLYPREKLFAGALEEQQGMVSYPQQLERDMQQFCEQQILNHVSADIYFPCTSP